MKSVVTLSWLVRDLKTLTFCKCCLEKEKKQYVTCNVNRTNPFDYVYRVCCKFAEGDSRILMQKMSRDRMKRYIKKDPVPDGVDERDWEAENEACAALQKKMGNIMSEQGLDYQQAWDANWRDVYAISELIMDRTFKSFMKWGFAV